MSISEADLRRLPAVPALALAVRCAFLARPKFENRWDDFYDDAVDCAVTESMTIASSPQGTKIMGPDGYADYCADLQGHAANDNLPEVSTAANSAAGAAYSAAIIADIYNGYRSEIPSNYFPNIKRAVDAACEIDGLNDMIQSEFQCLLAQVERDGLADYSPIDKSQMEHGFEDPARDA